MTTLRTRPSETNQQPRAADIFTRNILETVLMLVLTATAAVAAVLHIQNHQEYTEKVKAEEITSRVQLPDAEAPKSSVRKEDLRAALEKTHELEVINAQLRGELQKLRLDKESQAASLEE